MSENVICTMQGTDIKFNVPIQKFDAESRYVFGFATVDNIDKQDDRVLASASVKAFQKFVGNIREMHQPIAAGKLIKFEERQITDPATGEAYNGIFVQAYVSKGAESTWEKVVDGTLRAFSIYGPVLKSNRVFSPTLNKYINVIEEYELHELSLVDNPGNGLAEIHSVIKMDGTGMIADTKTDYLYWCEEDQVVAEKPIQEQTFCHCGKLMKEFGWIESAQDNREAIQKMLLQKGMISKEGGVASMAEGDVTREVESTEEILTEPKHGVVTTEDAVDVEDEKELKEEKTAEADEPDFDKFSKTLDGIAKSLSNLNTSVEAKDEAIAAINANLADVQKSVEAKFNELAVKQDELSKNLDGFKSNLETIEKKLGNVDKTTAVRKSADVEDRQPVSNTENNVWGGSAFSVR